MQYLKTWCLFTYCILRYCFSPASNNKYYLAGKCMFSLSFRYYEKQKSSFLFFFQSYIKAISLKKPINNKYVEIPGEGKRFLYEVNGSEANRELWVKHVEFFDKKAPDGLLWKGQLMFCAGFADKAFQVLFLTLLFCLLLPLTVFVKLKGSSGLIFFEFIELNNALKIMQEHKVERIYYCSIYEKDANISAIAMQKTGINVSKIASLTPLKYWNKIILGTNRLILSDTNQLNELEQFRNTIQVSEVEVWGPYNTALVAEHYKVHKTSTTEKIIGFYSTASYIRAMAGHIEQKNMLKNEDFVKKCLAEYIHTHHDTSLVVLLHPKERKPENADIVKEHYKIFFDGINYTIADWPGQSIFYFEKINLGVAMYSSVIYERIYFGFKSLMMPLEDKELMDIKTNMSSICAVNKQDMFSKMDHFLPLTSDEYFNLTGLKKSPFMMGKI